MTIGSNASSLLQQQLPSFLEGGNLQLFLEAYYEWLELQNTKEAKNAKDLFRGLPGPNALISDASRNRDIDTTVDQFVKYFYDQVIPVVVEGTHVDQRFSIKKIRDLYLSKGTPNSFKLFFRMLYAEEIDVFFPKDSILLASNGKYLSFPQVRATVIEGENILSFFNFQLSTLYNDSDGFDKGILVVDGYTLSNIGAQTVINLTLNSGTINLDFQRRFKLQDATNPANNITLEILVQLESADVLSSGAGYLPGDIIQVYDPQLFPVGVAQLRVDSVLPGPVEYVQIRDRGESYIAGDSISFAVDDVNDGVGGSAFITQVDPNGRIQAINGVMARTGPYFNGYQADDFENVNIPITDGGSYSIFPQLSITRNEINQSIYPISASRYNNLGGLGIQDAQLYPISQQIGRLNRVVPADPGFFQPSNVQNLRVQPPFNIITGSETDFPLGSVLQFQYFLPDSEGFQPDSEILDVQIVLKSSRAFTKQLRLPSYFDNDSDQASFQWYARTLNFTRTGNTTADINLIAAAILPGYRRVVGDVTRIDDARLYRLDGYHFNQLNIGANNFGFTYNDSDISITYSREFQNPRVRQNLNRYAPIMPNTGKFVNTPFGGRVQRRNTMGTQYSLEPFTERLLYPTDSDIQYYDSLPFSIIRVVQINPLTGDQITVNGFPISEYVTQWSGDVDLKINLSGPIYTAKRFINEDGFLDSPSGATLRDNYFYSEHTYVLQSTKSIYEWGSKVKELLHPAGTILISEININTTVPADQIDLARVDTSLDNGLLQMDNTLDSYIADRVLYDLVTADTTVQAASPYLLFNRSNANGLYIFADNFGKKNQDSQWSQRGNAMWDYEPIGLVNGYTSQSYNQADSDGNGSHYVRNVHVAQDVPFSTSVIDYYKGISDVILDREVLTYNIMDINFNDTVNEKYAVYDSDPPGLQAHVWNDTLLTEAQYFDRIRYDVLDSEYFIDSDAEFRVIATQGSNRNSEIRLLRNIDLQIAMRLERKLVFRDGNAIYYDFDAYERKWNMINTLRTINAEGWEIPGKTSALANAEGRDQLHPSDYRVDTEVKVIDETAMYATTKTPLTTEAFDWYNPRGTVVWQDYYPQALRDSDGTEYFPPYTAGINTVHPYVYGPFPRTSPPSPYDVALADMPNRLDPNSVK